ncbi:DNA-binding SARP family transcriptional activator [Saccharothrix carnea]|uniref:DNA-binding SARP family transcriptional activator n=1 Tax=Saccharothrix carnea TaxID=1280637 RepID=A0A2P8I2M6_SACCR|nr:AfsR/SARP family transcriptional regulator [Saccharothrix carnea]PSL52695.1 DNA-binding SARP family transcriptional activator [Saccharothrix carnea]
MESEFDPGDDRESAPAPVGDPDGTAGGGYRGPVRFSVLGPVEVWLGERDCTPKAPKVLQVLAFLLLRANRTVRTEPLIQELWGEDPPRSALTTIQTYAYQLRRLFVREGLAENGEDMLVTRSHGYALYVEPEQLDVHRFWALRDEGRALMQQNRFAEAAPRLRAALDLWSENPLVNVRLGAHLSAYVVDLQEQRRNTQQFAIEAEMELGLHRELIGELRAMTATHPLDEWFHWQLMMVLDRSGRRSEALHVYRSLRSTLNDELGIDPSREVQELHSRLLS